MKKTAHLPLTRLALATHRCRGKSFSCWSILPTNPLSAVHLVMGKKCLTLLSISTQMHRGKFWGLFCAFVYRKESCNQLIFYLDGKLKTILIALIKSYSTVLPLSQQRKEREGFSALANMFDWSQIPHY